MCTAITFSTKDHYFGRNLDFEHGYQEAVTITPRNYPFRFHDLPPITEHYAIIGMATVDNNYPLYYDATNEFGLSMAGLYFPISAKYMEANQGKEDLAAYELIPWVLSSCKTVAQGIAKLNNIHLVAKDFSHEYPTPPLHWILADAVRAVTIEPMKSGLHIYENKVGVLTNEPPFDFHATNLHNYLNITSQEATNRFAPTLSLEAYSRGMGGIGLPGDLSSPSRFIRAAFTKQNSVCSQEDRDSINQVFHILESVSQIQGCVQVGQQYEKTIYTSCCNTTQGIYYYTTYDNRQITGVRLHGENLDSDTLISYPLNTQQQIKMEN